MSWQVFIKNSVCPYRATVKVLYANNAGSKTVHSLANRPMNIHKIWFPASNISVKRLHKWKGLGLGCKQTSLCGNGKLLQHGNHDNNMLLCRLIHHGSKKHTQQFSHDLQKFGMNDFEDSLFDYFCNSDENVLSVNTFKQALTETGLRETDPRLQECMRALKSVQSRIPLSGSRDSSDYIDRETFKQCISSNIVLLAKAFRNLFIIPEFQQFTQQIDNSFWNARGNISGKVATYIPQLARYSPNFWAVSLCTVDGQRYSVGDVNVPFCLQSVSKPLTYALAMDELTPKVVHSYVGHEPSGTSFNQISLDYQDKPHNPMINAGAIVICSLLKQELNLADRFDYTTNMFKRLTGGEYLSFNNSVFLSERETADRNFALGYYMREKKCFPEGVNLMEVMDFYFQLCSVELTCDSGAVLAATLANGGVCPITGDKVLSATAVRDTLSLMHSCGMYDYSGEFAFRVGLPAKSGVSGGILLVVPNVLGLFLWSPPLDKWGNSVRGVEFCKDLITVFNFHHYDNLKFTPQKVDPTRRKLESKTIHVVNVLFSAYNGDVSALRRYALQGTDMKLADYDGRTALHIAAAEGHLSAVEFLLEKCKVSPFVLDRWGFTPYDDAKRFKKAEVASLLKKYMDGLNEQTEETEDNSVSDTLSTSSVTFGEEQSLENLDERENDPEKEC